MNEQARLAPRIAEMNVWLNSKATAHEKLGLLPEHTPEQRRNATREAIKQWHPDRPGGSDEMFHAVQMANNIINDTLLREEDATRFKQRELERRRQEEIATEGQKALERHEREDQLRASGLYGGTQVNVQAARVNTKVRVAAPWVVPVTTVALVSLAGAYFAMRPSPPPLCPSASSARMQSALNTRDLLKEKLSSSEKESAKLMAELNSPEERSPTQNRAMLEQTKSLLAIREQQREELTRTEKLISHLNCQATNP